MFYTSFAMFYNYSYMFKVYGLMQNSSFKWARDKTNRMPVILINEYKYTYFVYNKLCVAKKTTQNLRTAALQT